MIPSICFVILVVAVFAYLYYKGKLGSITSNEGLDVFLSGLLLLGWFFFGASGVSALFGYPLPTMPTYTEYMDAGYLLADIVFRWLVSLAFLVAVVHEEYGEA